MENKETGSALGAIRQLVGSYCSWQGVFWEDRYDATAIEADEQLRRCLAYIDLKWCASQS